MKVAVRYFTRSGNTENKDKIGKLYDFSTAALIASTYKQVRNAADFAEEIVGCSL